MEVLEVQQDEKDLPDSLQKRGIIRKESGKTIFEKMIRKR